MMLDYFYGQSGELFSYFRIPKALFQDHRFRQLSTDARTLYGIPFEVRLEQPNKETVAAMLEAERIAKDPSVKGYNDLDELFADLKR